MLQVSTTERFKNMRIVLTAVTTVLSPNHYAALPHRNSPTFPQKCPASVFRRESGNYKTLRRRVLANSTEWRTKCHTIDCARNTFLLLQKHLTSVTELILIGWKIVRNEEHVQCDHRFASQPLANEPLHSSQRFDTSLQKARGTTSLCGP